MQAQTWVMCGGCVWYVICKYIIGIFLHNFFMHFYIFFHLITVYLKLCKPKGTEVIQAMVCPRARELLWMEMLKF